jgi:hypothetical protein
MVTTVIEQAPAPDGVDHISAEAMRQDLARRAGDGVVDAVEVVEAAVVAALPDTPVADSGAVEIGVPVGELTAGSGLTVSVGNG